MASVDDLMNVLGVGEANAKIADEIGPQLGLDPGRTQEETRNLIRIAILDHGQLIGSTVKGYFIIDTESDYESAVGYLQRKIRSTTNRIEKLQQGWAARS